MGVKITGQEQMMSEIRSRMNRITGPQSERAINAGGQIVYKALEGAVSTYSGQPGTTGATKRETSFTVRTRRGNVKGHVYWQGSRGRYRLIHLNEKGYTRNGKFYSPRGRGAIARAMASSEEAYFRTVRRELQR